MVYSDIQIKKDKLSAIRNRIPIEALETFERSFDVEYAHHSTAIEGNTLSLIESKVIIEDGLSVAGKPLREIFEVLNHAKAFEFVKICVRKNEPLNERIVNTIHALLMNNILADKNYRNVSVKITGAGFVPPIPEEMVYQLQQFYCDLSKRCDLNPIELAAWTHAEFVRIHPYIDGNGRTSRLLMNYQLMRAGLLPISISKNDRIPYYVALDAYACKGDIKDFAEMIARLENQRLDEYLHILPSNEIR